MATVKELVDVLKALHEHNPNKEMAEAMRKGVKSAARKLKEEQLARLEKKQRDQLWQIYIMFSAIALAVTGAFTAGVLKHQIPIQTAAFYSCLTTAACVFSGWCVRYAVTTTDNSTCASKKKLAELPEAGSGTPKKAVGDFGSIELGKATAGDTFPSLESDDVSEGDLFWWEHNKIMYQAKRIGDGLQWIEVIHENPDGLWELAEKKKVQPAKGSLVDAAAKFNLACSQFAQSIAAPAREVAIGLEQVGRQIRNMVMPEPEQKTWRKKAANQVTAFYDAHPTFVLTCGAILGVSVGSFVGMASLIYMPTAFNAAIPVAALAGYGIYTLRKRRKIDPHEEAREFYESQVQAMKDGCVTMNDVVACDANVRDHKKMAKHLMAEYGTSPVVPSIEAARYQELIKAVQAEQAKAMGVPRHIIDPPKQVRGDCASHNYADGSLRRAVAKKFDEQQTSSPSIIDVEKVCEIPSADRADKNIDKNNYRYKGVTFRLNKLKKCWQSDRAPAKGWFINAENAPDGFGFEHDALGWLVARGVEGRRYWERGPWKRHYANAVCFPEADLLKVDTICFAGPGDKQGFVVKKIDEVKYYTRASQSSCLPILSEVPYDYRHETCGTIYVKVKGDDGQPTWSTVKKKYLFATADQLPSPADADPDKKYQVGRITYYASNKGVWKSDEDRQWMWLLKSVPAMFMFECDGRLLVKPSADKANYWLDCAQENLLHRVYLNSGDAPLPSDETMNVVVEVVNVGKFKTKCLREGSKIIYVYTGKPSDTSGTPNGFQHPLTKNIRKDRNWVRPEVYHA